MFYLLLTVLIHENRLCTLVGCGTMLVVISCISQGWAYR